MYCYLDPSQSNSEFPTINYTYNLRIRCYLFLVLSIPTFSTGYRDSPLAIIDYVWIEKSIFFTDMENHWNGTNRMSFSTFLLSSMLLLLLRQPDDLLHAVNKNIVDTGHTEPTPFNQIKTAPSWVCLPTNTN